MKCLTLGLSTAMIALLATSGSAAQNAVPAPAEVTPPPPTPSAEAPTLPTVAAPLLAPNPAPPNPAPPNPAPTANSAPNPNAARPQYPYPYPMPSYGYPNPYAPYGFGAPSEPAKELAYIDGRPIPNGYKLEEHYNLGLLIAGPSLFAIAYIVTMATAMDQSDVPPSLFEGGISVKPAPWHALYVPIAGPFAFAKYAPDGSGFIYVTEGIVQAVGVGLFLLGVLRPRDVLVRKETTEAFRPSLRVGPRQMQLEMRF